MSIQSTTDKVADNARNLANNVLQSAQEAVQTTRAAADQSLDKAEASVRALRRQAADSFRLALEAGDPPLRSVRDSRLVLVDLRRRGGEYRAAHDQALALLAPSIAHADDPPPAPVRAPIVAPHAPSLPESLPASPDANAPKLTPSQQAAANAVPPVACPEPCEACGRMLGGTAAAVGLPTWSKWLVGIGAGLAAGAAVCAQGLMDMSR